VLVRNRQPHTSAITIEEEIVSNANIVDMEDEPVVGNVAALDIDAHNKTSIISPPIYDVPVPVFLVSTLKICGYPWQHSSDPFGWQSLVQLSIVTVSDACFSKRTIMIIICANL
jgi:hypothetical protein